MASPSSALIPGGAFYDRDAQRSVLLDLLAPLLWIENLTSSTLHGPLNGPN